MCGIAALLLTDGQSVLRADVDRMNAAQAHRGPDGDGVHCAGSVGLGHRRLSIIDLAGGKQPLSNEDGTIWITFNGEIYNYRELRRDLMARGHSFRTDSDTETIVHAFEEWGAECLGRLRGMFAFAIWDGRRRELFLARDRFGIKPLVYWERPGLFAVASEIQGLKAHPEFDSEIDLSAIDLYLHYQYIPAPHTIYRDVRKLPPAHYLIVQADGTHAAPVRYWDFAFEPDRSLTEAAWVERIDAALNETVSAHLVSDVPFGAFLSGGIDSSSVVAYMSRLLPTPVRAFTIAHQSADYDERQWADEAARVCGVEHFTETVKPDALELLPELVQHFGEPFADSSAVAAFYVSRLARRHVKMALSGDGGDELFAGYYSYPSMLWEHDPPLSTARRTKRWVADAMRNRGLWPPRVSVADSKYERTAVIPAAVRRSLWQPQWAGLVDTTRAQFDSDFAPRRGEMLRGDRLLGRLQHYDVGNYIAYDNLPKVDTASMYHGLEVRVPLLDHVFVETARQVPPELKLRSSDMDSSTGMQRLTPGAPVICKYLLKKNAERFFSHDFLHRPKRGFEVPVQDWFSGPHAGELSERLTGPNSLLRDYFRRESLQSLVTDATQSRPAAWRGWSLLVLEEWLQQSKAKVVPRKASTIRVAALSGSVALERPV